MKQLIFTSLLFCVLTSCKIIPTNDDDMLYIKVDNISEFDIEDLIINETEFKNIKSGKDSRFKTVEYLNLQNNFLMHNYYEGKINTNNIQKVDDIMECATGLEIIKTGKFTLEIDVVTNQNNIPTDFRFSLVED